MEDTQIVDLYLSRDEQAIAQTSQRYGNQLRRLAYGIVDDWQTAEECENDTYMQAWERIPPHEPRGYLLAFLSRITRNLSINQCRRQERLKRNALLTELSAELECCIPAPNDVQCQIEAQLLAEIISGFLETLPKQQCDIFLRRYWFADSIDAIARRYLMTQSKVKSMLFRTRNLLREHLEKEGYIL